ncbi:MAG TPA: TMEM175 family protein [Ferruginibacter sp.]|nr:TMEM175 family protein [Ferruginibacter sp.]
MGKGRLEAFSDGVIAIIITIMVLEMKVPHGADIALLKPILPVFISYILSFVYIGIYWNNHHHMLHAAKQVSGPILWANLHLLFWLSLTPFVSGWMGENNFAQWPVIVYGIVLLMCAIAYYILAQMLANIHGVNSTLAMAIGKDRKGIISIVLYILGICFSFYHSLIGFSFYVIVAIIWFIPDRRIEKKLVDHDNPNSIA